MKVTSKATRPLLYLAARSDYLRSFMRLELNDGVIHLPRHPRPWLIEHPKHPDELTFDPDIFAQSLGKCSSGERQMLLWLLNVWNPTYATEQGWKFDLIEAVASLDASNLNCIIAWMQDPLWP